jgi:hypothetical protein
MELQTVKFLAAYGDRNREVELAYMKGGYFHVMIDKYFYGQIVKYNTGWAVALHSTKPKRDHDGKYLPYEEDKFFTTADLDAILERAGVL